MITFSMIWHFPIILKFLNNIVTVAFMPDALQNISFKLCMERLYYRNCFQRCFVSNNLWKYHKIKLFNKKMLNHAMVKFHWVQTLLDLHLRTRYPRMEQVKFFKDCPQILPYFTIFFILFFWYFIIILALIPIVESRSILEKIRYLAHTHPLHCIISFI